MQQRVCGREQEFAIVFFGKRWKRQKAKNPEEGNARRQLAAAHALLRALPKIVPVFYQGIESWLENGAKAYTDSKTFEAATAECNAGSLELVEQEKALEIILNRALKLLKHSKRYQRLALYKTNVDLSGEIKPERTFGCHQNYCYLGRYHKKIVRILRNFIPASLPITGSGHILRNSDGRYVYSFSQRASHMKCVIGESSFEQRGIIDESRDEDLTADSLRFRRLHVISRDATRCEFQTWLVDTITHLILRLAEERWRFLWQWELIDPVRELHILNKRIALNRRLKTRSGPIDVIEYNRIFWRAASRLKPLSAMEKRGLREWKRVLDLLAVGQWKKLIGWLDWPTKKWLLEKMTAKYGFGLADIRARKIDMDYHNISSSPKESWFAGLDQAGLIHHLASPEKIRQALRTSPETRAKTRSRLIGLSKRLPRRLKIVSLDWDKADIKIRADNHDVTILFGESHYPFAPTCSKLDQLLKKAKAR